MESPLILDLIFERFPMDVLKTCRLVCKQWYGLSFRHWRKRAVLCIHNSILQSITPLSLAEFNRLIAAAEDYDELDLISVPFQSFKLINFNKWTGHEIKFLEKWGKCIRTLHLEECTVGTNLMELLHRLTPNLRRITFNGIGFKKFPMDMDLLGVAEFKPYRPTLRSLEFQYNSSCCNFPSPFSWSEFLLTVPNMKRLALPRLNPQVFLDILKTIHKVRTNNSTAFSLTRLCFRINKGIEKEEMLNDIVALLLDLNLPLSEFSFEFFMCHEPNPSAIQSILNSCSETVQILRGNLYCRKMYFTPKTIFRSLTHLELYCGKLDLKFLKQMPRLQKLILNIHCVPEEFNRIILDTLKSDPEMKSMSFPSIMHFRLVNTLEIHQSHKFGLSPDSVWQIKEWMPKLLNFTGVFSRKGFGVLCRYMTQLEKLTVWNDDGEIRNDNVLIGSSLQPNEDEEGVCEKRSPGISALINLKSFAVRMSEEGEVTDKAILHGFLKLPQLKRLYLPTTNVTDAVREAIEKRLNHAVVFNATDNDLYYADCQYFHKFLPEDHIESRRYPFSRRYCSFCSFENLCIC